MNAFTQAVAAALVLLSVGCATKKPSSSVQADNLTPPTPGNLNISAKDLANLLLRLDCVATATPEQFVSPAATPAGSAAQPKPQRVEVTMKDRVTADACSDEITSTFPKLQVTNLDPVLVVAIKAAAAEPTTLWILAVDNSNGTASDCAAQIQQSFGPLAITVLDAAGIMELNSTASQIASIKAAISCVTAASQNRSDLVPVSAN